MLVSHDAVVIPLKRFDVAKERLRRGGDLDVTALARELARAVVLASAPRPVVVVSEDDEVSHFAAELGAEVWESGARDLNEAVQGAYRGLGRRFERLLVVHGDLRQPEGLGGFEPGLGVTIVTDHCGDGTNVLVAPTGLDFRFAYGPGSRFRHEGEARRLGIECHVVTDSPWRFDIDEPEDLTAAERARHRETGA
jgi:2-phospho-L-lactate guanylyltransferase